MKTSLVALILTLYALPSYAQPQPAPADPALAWTGTVEQRIWGLMTIWSEARYAYPSFDRLPDLDWDAAVQAFIPRVIEAEDLEAYYGVLMEFGALLRDGHTGVMPPWGFMEPGTDQPSIEVQVIDGRFFVARAGDAAEVEEQRVRPGLEILETGDGVPIAAHFQDAVLRYRTRGCSQADEAINIWYLLRGPKGSKVTLKVRDTDGAVRTISLTRDSAQRNGAPFQYRFVQWNMVDPVLETRMLEDGVLYVKVAHFNDPELATRFRALVDGLDPTVTRGMVVDLRYNLGGRSDLCDAMIGCLIDAPAASATWKYRSYIAAYRAWGREMPWSETSNTIQPREGKRYTGPLVLLTGPATNSTAEDMALILRSADRAALVGARTAGSSGNPIQVPLPGGGSFRVATFQARTPEGEDYVGTGLSPDVEVGVTVDDIIAGGDPILRKGVEVVRRRPSAGDR